MEMVVHMEETVIAVDPGREKCGVAVVRRPNRVLLKKVIATRDLIDVVSKLTADFEIDKIVLGDRTSSDKAKNTLSALAVNKSRALDIALVDEHLSTDAARKRYWLENPPKGLRKLIPIGMQVPPVPVDDYVAVILAERYFNLENKKV